MLNPENATTESVDVPETPSPEQAPLSEAEQAELAALYTVTESTAAESSGVEGVATVESVDTSIIGSMERLGEFSDDPAEFGTFLSQHVGETYMDQISGETLIRPIHLEIMDALQADIGQAVGLLKQGGSRESISRLVGTAWEKADTLPPALRPHITAIMTRYYKKNDPGNQ